MRKWLGKLPRWSWKKYLAFFVVCGFMCVICLIGLVVLLWQAPPVQAWFISTMLHGEAHKPLPEPASPSLGPEGLALVSTNVSALKSPADFFRPTNVWSIHLRLTTNDWTRLGPKRVPAIPGFIQADGTPILRNTNASRAGIAGVLGIDLPWSQGEIMLGDLRFTNVGVRFKGNGTFLSSMRTYKRPFKIELNKHATNQHFLGRTIINLNNLSADFSYLADTLGYEFYRNAGVPAPRTALARCFLTLEGRFENRVLGLYVLVENPDAQWARDCFGADDVALFKPVTYELFKDLGDQWAVYDGIYDPKTRLTERQQRRVIELARLNTSAPDDEFAKQLPDFLELEETARFFACEVLLANYDSILSNGQNFLLYLDPRSHRFGFIPWDLDHSWGEFPFIGSAADREQASIWQPWVGQNRFLERLFAVEKFRALYRAELERLLTEIFVPERLNQRMDELSAIVQPMVREESRSRLEKHQIAVSDRWTEGPRDGNPMDENRPVFQLKRFIQNRAAAVREQLDGRSSGVILRRIPFK
ncbi:MAG: CotH kinase family protein [Verrucomicrobiota bacterium]